jgi:steroid 5-alpha reductase family enzyme
MATAAAIGLFAIVLSLTGAWIVSLFLRDASIADVCWGLGFVALAWLYRGLLGANGSRSLLVAGLVTLWGVRLSVHIYRRGIGHDEDPRYASMRARHGRAFWWRSLLVVFWLQGALLWFIALPLLVAARGPEAPLFAATDVLGLLMFATGFAFEAVGDLQLQRFKRDPSNRGRVLDRGLWRYTRHPNYFGDALLWWGLYLLSLATPGGWLTLLSPALMTFLLVRVSGVTLLEEGLRVRKPAYADYVARTSAFLPWFPRRRA